MCGGILGVEITFCNQLLHVKSVQKTFCKIFHELRFFDLLRQDFYEAINVAARFRIVASVAGFLTQLNVSCVYNHSWN